MGCSWKSRSTSYPRTATSTTQLTSRLQRCRDWRLSTTASKWRRGVRTPTWRRSTIRTRPSWTGTWTSRQSMRRSRSTHSCLRSRTRICRGSWIRSWRRTILLEETWTEKKRSAKSDTRQTMSFMIPALWSQEADRHSGVGRLFERSLSMRSEADLRMLTTCTHHPWAHQWEWEDQCH